MRLFDRLVESVAANASKEASEQEVRVGEEGRGGEGGKVQLKIRVHLYLEML